MDERRGGPPDERGAAAWLPLSDALLRGVGHELNNRVAALSAIVQVLSATGGGGPLQSALVDEAGRLQRAVELLRVLPRRWHSPPEPVLVSDAVHAALQILPLHPELPVLRYEWSSEGDLPPVLVEPSLLTHALCLIGHAVAAARESGDRVLFHGEAADGMVSVTVVADGAAGGSGAGGSTTGGDPTGAAPLVELAGGEMTTLESAGGALRVELRLPTLAEARRREG